MEVDAIVNAANTALRMGGGVCGAIFRAAGPEELQKACDMLAPINTGQAVITPGFASKARYIIHAAGPIYKEGDTQQESQLYNCYARSLRLAVDNGCRSIAFPLISSGIYGYPPHEALRVAERAIRDFIGAEGSDIDVYLIVYNNNAFQASVQLFSDVRSYIDEHLVEEEDKHSRRMEHRLWGLLDSGVCAAAAEPVDNLFCRGNGFGDVLDRLEDSFSTLLIKYIRRQGMSNTEVYKEANLDRRLFSKIISNSDYAPAKPTVLALVIALRLNLDDAATLLKSAGFAISHSQKVDLVVEYFIKKGGKDYNIFQINDVLMSLGLPQFGSKSWQS